VRGDGFVATDVIASVRLVGLASAVPVAIRTVDDETGVFGDEEARRISRSVGVRQRHVVSDGMCASDLCYAAAERLLQDLGWNRESVDVLLFVSQTPDYLLPATACALHNRLKLAKHCAAFDVNLGCSGYVYGLWIVSSLLTGGRKKRALLLAGDTITRIVSPQDRSAAPLFGDAGTATAVEYCEGGPLTYFEVGTDGSGQNDLIVPAGGFRRPRTTSTAIRTIREGDNIRSDEDLFMDGAEVFAFTLREVPALVKSVLAAADWTPESVDAFVLHQANRFMLEHLAKRMRLPEGRVVLALENYGNTSLASIPLAISYSLGDTLRGASLRLVLAGFGVGFSWGAAAITCGPLAIPEILTI
jgi:3-oxoacyl-[acyl-carrier-protein] synthase III